MDNVGGHPFLDIILSEIKKQGIVRVILCAGYKAEALEEYYRKNHLGLQIEFSKEVEPLGTGGAVKNAKAFVKSDHFFVLNGDSLCRLDLKEIFNFHLVKKAMATIAVSEVKDAKDFGSIVLDKELRIKAFSEKEKSSAGYVNAGIYVFERKIFDLMPAQKQFSAEKDLFPKLAGKEFYGFITKEEFIDIGTPERYRVARVSLRRR